MMAHVRSPRRLAKVVITLTLALIVSGCERRAKEIPDAFSWTETLPPGSSIHIRNGVGQITVVPSRDAMVRVTGGKRWRRGRERDIKFLVTRGADGNDAYVCAMWRASGRCGASGYRGKRTETFLSYFSLFHRTTDASASFIVEIPAGVAIDARTTNGSVTIRGTHGGGGVYARTVVGSITALGLSGGPVTLETTTGSIHLAVDSLAFADTIQARTVNGAVTAQLPPTAEAEFDLSTVRGAVTTDYPLHRSQGRRFTTAAGRIGSAPRLVKLHAVRGSVALVKTLSSDSG